MDARQTSGLVGDARENVGKPRWGINVMAGPRGRILAVVRHCAREQPRFLALPTSRCLARREPTPTQPSSDVLEPNLEVVLYSSILGHARLALSPRSYRVLL